MLMCCSLLVWAQNTVTGTVLDESNLEVIGANVKEKGTANGAITDMNGVFHLKVSNLQKAVLQISFMGYEPQEVPLNGRKQLKIILKETAKDPSSDPDSPVTIRDNNSVCSSSAAWIWCGVISAKDSACIASRLSV
jgi:hypothetical protein